MWIILCGTVKDFEKKDKREIEKKKSFGGDGKSLIHEAFQILKLTDTKILIWIQYLLIRSLSV